MEVSSLTLIPASKDFYWEYLPLLSQLNYSEQLFRLDINVNQIVEILKVVSFWKVLNTDIFSFPVPTRHSHFRDQVKQLIDLRPWENSNTLEEKVEEKEEVSISYQTNHFLICFFLYYNLHSYKQGFSTFILGRHIMAKYTDCISAEE